MNVKDYPYVISSNYRLLLSEEEIEGKSREEKNDNFRQIIRTFSAMLKFLALLLLAEYLDRVNHDSDTYKDEQVDKFISNRNNIGRPSLGQFANLLRLLISASSGWLDESSLSGFANIVKGERRKNRFLEELNHLIHVRNLFVHSDIVPSEDELKKLILDNKKALDDILKKLDWLTDGELLLIRPDGTVFQCRETVKNYTGPNAPVESGVWWVSGGRRIAMPPFLIHKFVEGTDKQFPDSPAGNDIDVVMQYETLQGKKVKYLFGREGLYEERKYLFEDLQQLIDAAKRRLMKADLSRSSLGTGKTKQEEWGDIVSRAKKKAMEIIKIQEDNGKFRTDLYAPRKEIENQFHSFLESDRRLLIIVGTSGCGKTNLLCHLTKKLCNDDHAVLHYYGRCYGGKDLIDIFADNLNWERKSLASQLAACSEMTLVKNKSKRLVVFMDAINEYTHPGKLFDQIIDFIEHPKVPVWFKVVVTCRPVPWEHIEPGFKPDKDRVFFKQARSAKCEPQSYLTLGPFTDDELGDAWKKWKEDEKSRAGQFWVDPGKLDETIIHLLRQPLLFSCYKDYLKSSKKQSDRKPLKTAEDILFQRYLKLNPFSQRCVDDVKEVMWKNGKDYLTSEEYTKTGPDASEAEKCIERWISSDQGEDTIKIYSCQNVNHRRTSEGEPWEFAETNIFRKEECTRCDPPSELVVIHEEPFRPPLMVLRDEGLLTLYSLPDGDELLRFTYDRMYETLTGRYLKKLLMESPEPEKDLYDFVRQNSDPDKAAVCSAVCLALLMLLQQAPDKQELLNKKALNMGETMLTALAQEPAAEYLQAFIRSVLLKWAEEDFDSAWEFALHLIYSGVSAWKQRKVIESGLQAGIVVSTRLMAEAHGKGTQANQSKYPEKIAEALKRLIDVVCDPGLIIDWGSSSLTHEQCAALANTNPGDICLHHLLGYCQAMSRFNATDIAESQEAEATDSLHDSTDNSIAVVRGILSRLHGVPGLFRYRKRIKAIVNWLTRLITLEIRNEKLVTGFVNELRAFLQSLPFMGASKGRITILIRNVLLKVISWPIIAIINQRLARQGEMVSLERREDRNAPLPSLFTGLYLTEEASIHFKRFIELYSDFDLEITRADVQMIVDVTRQTHFMPFSMIFHGLAGVVTLQGMRSITRAIDLARELENLLKPEDWFIVHTNALLIWSILHYGKAGHVLTDNQYNGIVDIVKSALKRQRKGSLSRYFFSGQYMVFLCGLQLPELFRSDGEMPGCKRFIQEALDGKNKDWALAARFWDQMLFTALQGPKPVRRYFEQVVDFESEKITITCCNDPIDVSLSTLKKILMASYVDNTPEEGAPVKNESRKNTDKPIPKWYRPGFKLDEANNPEMAVLHLLGTLGTLELAFPKEIDSFYRRKEVPERWIALIRDLAHPLTMQKLRDEKLLNYFGDYCILEFPALQGLLVKVLQMIYGGAERRQFRKPSRADLSRLMAGVLDMVLDLVHTGEQEKRST